MTAHGNTHVLDLGKHFEAVLAAFTAGARAFDPPERLAQIPHVLAVDKYHARFDTARQAVGLADVLGPDVGGQPVFGVVGQLQGLGFILERDQAHHRPEDFLLGDAHPVIHVGKHRRLDKLAAAQVRRQVGRTLQATGQQRGAFLQTDLDIAGDLVVMGLGDHRADLGLRVLGVAHDQALGSRREFGDKLRVDAFLDKDPAASGATLAVEGEDREQCGVEGAFQVGVFKNQHRRLAAQFHGVLFQAGALHDFLTGGGAAGKGNRPHVRVAHQCITGGGAVALDHIEHAIGNPGFHRQAPQFIGGQRRQLRHLQHRRIAQRQARRGLPGGGHERHVPRRHQPAHAYRLVQGVVEHLVVHRVGVAVHAGADFSEEIEVVRGTRDQHVLGLMDRQAGVQGFQLGQVGHVLFDQLTQFAHQACALFGWRIGPLGKRRLGRRYRLRNFFGAAAGHFADGLAGGRVVVDKGVFAFDLTAVDPVFDHGAQASLRAEKNSVSLTIRLTRRPTPSTSTTTSSPGTTSARPSGVPVAIMSPGCRVMKLDRYSMR